MKFSKKVFGIALIGVFYNLFIAIFQFSLIFLMMQWYGTELNGFVKICMVFAGIFGISDTANGINGMLHLFKPLQARDWTKCNEILSTTNKGHKIGGFIYTIVFLVCLFGYTIYTDITGGIHIIDENNVTEQLSYWKSVLIMFCISSKNILSLFWTAKYENLLSADNNNHYRYIVALICDSLIYGSTFLLIIKGVDVSLVFLPFLAFSLIKSLLLYIFVKYRYPWIKISKEVNNLELTTNSKWISFRFVGQTLLANTDIAIIALLFGLNISSAFALYMLIVTGIREIMITLIVAFRAFFGNWISLYGRVNWSVFRRFELYSYLVGLFTFVNMFLLTPYFVDALYGSVIVNSANTWTDVETQLYTQIFLRPEFSLLISLINFFIIISEPANTLIFAKNHFRKTSKFTLSLGIANTLMMVIFAFMSVWVGHNYTFALYSMFTIECISYFILFVYQWVYVRLYLTYNANIKGLKQNIFLIFSVILISIIMMYVYLYPSTTWTFNSIDGTGSSNVSNWTFSQFLTFFLTTSVITFISILGLFIITHPIKSLNVFVKLPIINKIYSKYENKNLNNSIIKEQDEDLFNIDLKNEIISSQVDDKLDSSKREKEVYIINSN
ncbi:hypothetical protein [Spiroplasma endosymbiont of Amphibalanus improvisus]|uniref:hypothetical protein n=1 Tax=Spiroplasma endosymbiont of Amphibalanus improvisus TaxID=3066327 RepID=UPI00313B35B6